MYFGMNKDKLYVLDELQQDGFVSTLESTSLYFVAQAFTFFVVLVFLKVGGNLNAFSLAISYIHHLDLFGAVLSASVLINFASYGFFLKHAGCDPEFEFENTYPSVNATEGSVILPGDRR